MSGFLYCGFQQNRWLRTRCLRVACATFFLCRSKSGIAAAITYCQTRRRE